MDLYVSEHMANDTGSASLGWENPHRGSLAVTAVPGDHMSMVTKPYVRVVAETLASALRSAQMLGTERVS